MAVRPESSTEEIRRLRRCINDLVSILALPATWTGSKRSRIVEDLLDALLNTLNSILIILHSNIIYFNF